MTQALGRNEYLYTQNKSALFEALRTLDVHRHIALIYETQTEQFDAALPFIKIGLDRNEKCIYITDDNESEEVIRAGSDYGIDIRTALRTGALSVTDPSTTYLRDGYFDADRMFEFLAKEVEMAKAEGYTALRATGEMTWELGNADDEDLFEYESRLNEFLDEYDALAICQYNRERFDPSVLIEIIHTHPNLVYGYTVAENYHYIPPSEYLNPDPDREFERLLTEVIDHDRLQKELIDREHHQTVLSNVIRHNMRNQLNVIAGNADLLNEGGEKYIEESRNIKNAADKLIGLTELAGRIGATLNRAPANRTIPLNSLLDDLVRDASSRYPRAEISINIDQPISVLARPTISTALEELLINAIKHSDRKTPRVEISATVDEGAVDITVADDGPGIPEMEVRTLTEEQAIDPLYHSSGLGLWLVHWIVTRSQGKIRFQERDPRGSAVTVRLVTADYFSPKEQ